MSSICRRATLLAWVLTVVLSAAPAWGTCPPPVATTAGTSYLVDFDTNPEGDDPKPGDIITTEYAADQVCFIDDMDLSRPMIIDPVALTHSEPQALQNHFTLGGGGDVIGSRDTPLRIYFLTPMQDVSMRIGWGTLTSLPAQCTDPITLRAWGRTAAGTSGEVATVSINASAVGLDVTLPISVAVGDLLKENIIWVELDFHCFFPEVLDHLEFVSSGVPPVPDTTDPMVQIDAPAFGTVFNAPLVPVVTGTIFEEDSYPTIDVNGVPGTVTPASGLGNYTFQVPSVPLPVEGTNTLIAKATDASGRIDTHSIDVQRATPATVSLHNVQITQTGIVDPQPQAPPFSDPPIFLQPTPVFGKTTLVRVRPEVLSAGGVTTFIDDAVLEVFAGDGTLRGAVPTSAYSPQTTGSMDCADLTCGIHFFIPGDMLTGTSITSTFLFQITWSAAGAPVDQDALGPIIYRRTLPYGFLVAPVETAWHALDEEMVARSLDLMARNYPGRDGHGFFSVTAPPPGPRGMEWVVPAPVELVDDPGDWEWDWVNDGVDLMQVEESDVVEDECVDVTPQQMPGLRLARTAGHPEDTDRNGTWSTEERGRMCPWVPGRPAKTRYNNLISFLKTSVRSERDDYNAFYGPPMGVLLSTAIDTPGVYVSASLNQNWDGDCGGHGKNDWSWNVGGIFPNCAKVVAQEYSHAEELWCHSRDQMNLNGILVEELPDCGPLEDDEGDDCDGQIPTANGAAYNLLNRVATSLRFSFLTSRDPGGRDTFANNYIRNPEFKYLAQMHSTGWYFGPLERATCAENAVGSESAAVEHADLQGVRRVAGNAGLAGEAVQMAMNPWRIVGSLNRSTGDVLIVWAGPAHPDEQLTPAGSGGGHSLDFRDAGGALLLSHPLDVDFNPVPHHPEHGDEFDPSPDPDIGDFRAVVDPPAATQRIELADGMATLWSIDRGTSPPVVTLTLPAGGESFPRGQEIDIEWIATDTDPGAVLYTKVEYSPDGGASFLPLGAPSHGSARPWRPYLDPGTDDGVIRVQVTDGFDVAAATNAAPFRLEDAPPMAVLLDPEDQSQHLQHEELALRVFAFDPEGGMLDGASVAWSSDVDGALGDGATLIVRDLTPGTHIIDVTVTDAESHVEVRSVGIKVDADSDRDGLTDDFEKANGLDPDDHRDAVWDVDEDGLHYVDEVFLGTDPANPDMDGDGLPDGEEARRGSSPFIADTDGDDTPDGADNCLLSVNDQTDGDGDGAGDACDNCPTGMNVDQADLDRDEIGDLCDRDDDNDGALDAVDCAPTDPSAFALPGEPGPLTVSHGPTPAEITLAWSPSGAGLGAVFDVVAGLVDDLAVSGFTTAVCGVDDRPGDQIALPLAAFGSADVYFLVREGNACGDGDWGLQTGGPRLITACP